MMNDLKLQIWRAALLAKRIAGSAVGLDVNVLFREECPDYTVDITVVNLPDGKAWAIVSYHTTRKVIPPRDMKRIDRRMESYIHRFAPPGATVTKVLVIDTETKVTLGAMLYAKMKRIIIHRHGSKTAFNVFKRFLEKRLEAMYFATRFADRLSTRFAAAFAVLATIYRMLIGKPLDKLNALLIGDKIRQGVTMKELWQMIMPRAPPPSAM
jgi:hypothetical protein